MSENIRSKRDKPKFSHDGYLYVFDKCSKSDPTLLFWRCQLKNECKGRIHTKNSQVVNEVNEHSHSASAADVEVASIKTSLKRKAQETLEVPSIIINECIENSSQAAQGTLPNSQALKKIIRRKRNLIKSKSFCRQKVDEKTGAPNSPVQHMFTLAMSSKCKTECAGSESKKQRCAITLEEKLKIISMYEDGKIISAIARAINRPISTVNTIVKDKVRILESTKDARTLKGTIITKKRLGPIAEMENLLSQWIDDMTQKQVPLSFVVIQEKAKSLHRELQDKAGITDTEGAFKASAGWFERFKRRSNLHSIKVTATSADIEKFPEVLAEVIEEGEYMHEQIFNVNETALFWKRMSAWTKEDSQSARDRVTVMVAGNTTGDMKLKPLTVYHSPLRNIDTTRLPVIWKSNTKAWVTRELFIDWVNNHFIPQVKAYCARKGIPFKVLLILHNAPGHLEGLDDFHPDVKVICLPPRATPPTGQGAVVTFKAYYLRRMFSQAIEARGEGLTLCEFFEKYNILDAVKNIQAAWDGVKHTTMNPAWKKFCPEMVYRSKQEQQTDAVVELTQVSKACVQLADQLGLKVDDADVNELLCHDEELEAIRDSEGNAKQIELPEGKRFTTKGLSEVFTLIDIALEKLESMDPDTERFENVSRRIHSEISGYKAIYDYRKRLLDDKPDYPHASTSRRVKVPENTISLHDPAQVPTLPVQSHTSCHITFTDFEM